MNSPCRGIPLLIAIRINQDQSRSIRTFWNIKVLKILIGHDRSWSRSGPILIAIRTYPDREQKEFGAIFGNNFEVIYGPLAYAPAGIGAWIFDWVIEK
jgi:hypothetical protein